MRLRGGPQFEPLRALDGRILVHVAFEDHVAGPDAHVLQAAGRPHDDAAAGLDFLGPRRSITYRPCRSSRGISSSRSSSSARELEFVAAFEAAIVRFVGWIVLTMCGLSFGRAGGGGCDDRSSAACGNPAQAAYRRASPGQARARRQAVHHFGFLVRHVRPLPSKAARPSRACGSGPAPAKETGSLPLRNARLRRRHRLAVRIDFRSGPRR